MPSTRNNPDRKANLVTILCGAIAVLLIVLKLTHVLTCSWWIILAPVFLWVIAAIIVIALLFLAFKRFPDDL